MLIVGTLIGLPQPRLRGDYLRPSPSAAARSSAVRRNADEQGIGFDLDLRQLRHHARSTRSGSGTRSAASGYPPSTGPPGTRNELFFSTALALLPFTVFCSVRLRDSRLGRARIAIREDETAAAAMGVPLMRTKTWSYAIGAFFGGVAGAFYAIYKFGAFPADFYFQFSVFLLCMVILGGMGSVWGVIVGALILSWLDREGLAKIGDYIGDFSGPRSTSRSTRSGSTARSSS